MGQQKMAQIINRKLALKSIVCQMIRGCHYASIVDQYVDLWVTLQNGGSELTHRTQIACVQTLVRYFADNAVGVNKLFHIFSGIAWITNTCSRRYQAMINGFSCCYGCYKDDPVRKYQKKYSNRQKTMQAF